MVESVTCPINYTLRQVISLSINETIRLEYILYIWATRSDYADASLQYINLDQCAHFIEYIQIISLI